MSAHDAQLDALQTLLIFKLLFTGEEPKFSDAKPNLPAARRNRLRDLGLIAYEKRGRATHIVLTDAAWAWAGDHLDAPFSISTNGAKALEGLLPKLKAYLERTGTPLAEVLAAPLGAAAAPPVEDLSTAIRLAYLACSGGQWNARVRLAELRPHLAPFSRSEQDAALLALQQEGKAVLYNSENPMELQPADHDAALHVLGQARHVVYLRG